MAQETRVECNTCGNIWHYNDDDKNLNFQKKCSNTARMFGIFSMRPALMVKKREEITDFNRCPKCGSRNTKSIKINYSKNAPLTNDIILKSEEKSKEKLTEKEIYESDGLAGLGMMFK